MASTIINLFFSFIVLLLRLHFSVAQSGGMKGIYWFSASEFPVSDIDSTLFTHLFCAFADLDPNTFQITISFFQLCKFQNLHSNRPTQKSHCQNDLIHRRRRRQRRYFRCHGQPVQFPQILHRFIHFLSQIQQFLRHRYRLGIPINPNSNLLVSRSLYRVARRRGERIPIRKSRLFLSAAVFRSSNYYGLALPASFLGTKLDWINVMCYDFYGPGWSPNFTAPPAALFGSGGQVNCDAGITSWIQSGFPASKIMLGIPFYGWAWRLVNQSNNGLYAPAMGEGIDDGDKRV
ncbi:unnamed protein product [Citrullus colocynthis]|uniref:GH18 domain-containing protein n=1 Tax=Citrullus colocynthis TaxID=252529 RepID=A0ABP0ZCF1_9ROSI